MNIKELKVGNYYQAKSPEKKKYEPKHMLCSFGLEQAINNEINLKGIELTDEWYYKLGFQSYGHIYTLHFESGFSLSYNTSLKSWFVSIHSTTTASIKGFKYVHEIQTFYYSLTGKDVILRA